MDEPTWLDVQELTTYQIAPDGSSTRLNMLNSDGKEVAVIVQMESVKQLALTMPKIMTETLRKACGNPSLRLVHNVEKWAIERNEKDGLILTFKTPDNFEVSFSVADKDLTSIAEAMVDYEIEAYPGGLHIH